MDFTIRIANTNIFIHSVNRGIYNICRNYLITNNEKPDICIYSDEEKIEAEYEYLHRKDKNVQKQKSIEILMIQRLIAESLLQRDILLIHGAVIAINNTAYMFTGPSGTGKTTQINKWLANAPESVVVNGDKPFVILNEQGAFACGTPWSGKESMGNNIIVPLRSIVFMTRSHKNRIESVSFNDIFPSILGQTYHPSETELQRKTLTLLMQLKDRVSFFIFYFDHYQEDAFKVPYEALTKQDQG